METFIYYAILVLGVFSAAGISVLCGRDSNITKRNLVLFTVTGFLSGLIGAFVISVPYNLFLDAVNGGKAHDVSRFSLFGALLFMPLLMLIPARLTATPYHTIMDICTPGVYAVLTAGKLGCTYLGCCYGVPFENGITSAVTGEKVFPIQAVEAVFTLTLLVGGIIFTMKKNRSRGIVYPVMLSVYSVGRFLCEFGRNAFIAESAFTHCLDFWQIICIISLIVSIFCIIFIKKSQSVLQKSVSAIL